MKFAKRLSSSRSKRGKGKEAIIIPCELSLDHCQLARVPSALSESSSDQSPNDLLFVPYYPVILPLRAKIMATGTLSASGDGTVEHLFPTDPPPLAVPTKNSTTSSPSKSFNSRSPSSFSTTTCSKESSSNFENNDDLNGSSRSSSNLHVTTPTSLISKCLSDPNKQLQPSPVAVVFKRTLSSFLRVADLEMDETVSLARSSSSLSSDTVGTTTMIENNNLAEESFPNYHHISVDPPPGIAVDPKERWVVLDNGQGSHAPLAPMAVRALVKSGMTSMYDEAMWTAADAKTAKFIKLKPSAWPSACTWQRHGGVVQLPITSSSAADEQEIMVWSGSFKHGLYGSELVRFDIF